MNKTDFKLIKQLVNEGQIKLIPAGWDPVRYILDHAMKYRCTVVSNNSYYDYLKRAEEGKLGTHKECLSVQEVISKRTKKFIFVGHDFLCLDI